MYFQRKLLLLIILIFVARAASAGDTSITAVLGFSKDGKYFAFERYGTHDGSGFPFSEIYILDVCKNDWANPPIRFTLEDTGDEDVARNTNLKNAKAALDKFKIDLTIKGTSIPRISATTNPKNVPFKFEGQDMQIKLSEVRAPKPADCIELEPSTMFTLSLTRKGVTSVLQKDTKLPKSRGCAYSYSIQEIVCYGNSIAVIVGYLTPGFEGPNSLQLAVSGCFK